MSRFKDVKPKDGEPIPDPAWTNTTIDFRAPRWGHNILGFIPMPLKDHSTAMVICTPGPIPGDKITWQTAYGTAEAKVLVVEPCGDPQDMYNVLLRVTDRIPKNPAAPQEKTV